MTSARTCPRHTSSSGFAAGTTRAPRSTTLSSHGATYYDLPFIVAVVFVVAATIVVLTLVADLAYGLLDPRIRVRHAGA